MPARLAAALTVATFAALYIALDATSFIAPLYGLNLTPWNPAPALGLIYLLRFGRRAVVPLALAIFLADASVLKHPAVVELDLENPAVPVVARRLDAAAPNRFAFDGHRASFSGVSQARRSTS